MTVGNKQSVSESNELGMLLRILPGYIDTREDRVQDDQERE